ncbi:hypothetical protein NHQ30_011253 [Ciborinia camelliae]|nr:hypothetical protein NHQ30_011253 [Ciborinia camelliae]
MDDRLQVKEKTFRKPQRLDSPKRRRRRKKPYITTKAECQEHSCPDPDHDNELMECYDSNVTLAMGQERDCGNVSSSSSSSTPRVLTCAEPREIQYPDATEDLACTDQNIMRNINSDDGSQPIRYFPELSAQQGPAVDTEVYHRFHSVPTLPRSRSQVQFHENSRRHSDPNPVYGKAPSLRSELPIVSKQPINQSTWCNNLSLSQSNRTPSRPALMDDFSTMVGLPNGDIHFESSPRNIQDDSSAFELSMLYDKWQNISKMRSQIGALREHLRIMRLKLRALQNDRFLADDAYFKEAKLRELHMPFPRFYWPKKTLEELLCDSQKARDEYGPLEDEYNHLEHDLTSQEDQLSKQEEQFYSQLQDPSRFLPVSREPRNASSLLESEYPEPYEPHPLIDAYLSKLGDIDIFRERYDDILDEKLILEEELASRERFDMTLLPENQQWLDSSQSLLDDLKSKIQVAEMEEGNLRRECFSLGLIDENGEPKKPSKGDQPGPTFSTAHKTPQIPHEYVKPPSQFYPNPNISEVIMKALDSDHNHLARNERFDRWSLEKLQISIPEINIYANCSDNYDQLKDFRKLQEELCKKDFMNAWFTDGFTNNAPKSTSFTSMHSTSQYIPQTNSSSSKLSPSDVVFSNGSSHSGSYHSDNVEGGVIPCVMPLSNVGPTALV